MKFVKKFEVKLVPNTMLLAYASAVPVDLKFEVIKFNDGSLCVKLLNPEFVKKQHTLYVEAYLQNMDDLMVAMQLKDIVMRLTDSSVNTVLTITSPLYSRYDRVMEADKRDAFGASLFGSLVSTLGYGTVRYVDCHSRVLVEKTRNAHDISQAQIFEHMTSLYPNLKDMIQVAPDKGAVAKNPSAEIQFAKTRNVSTGKIEGMQLAAQKPTFGIEAPTQRKNYLVVDDLCEGGGTFIGLRKEFNKEFGANNDVSLFVTHGLFTNGAIDKLQNAYTCIYTYIMDAEQYANLDKWQRAIVKPMYLVDLNATNI